VEAALDVLGKLTAGVREVTLPAMASVPTLIEPEMYVYHAPYFDRTPELFQAPIRKRLELGRTMPASVYVQARRRRASCRTASRRRANETWGKSQPSLR
jgi:hypothetical protein